MRTSLQKIVLNENSSEMDYMRLFLLKKGDVFKISSGYETVMMRIAEHKPENLVFEVFPINPGTSLYTMYGPDHLVVTDTYTV